MNKRLKNVVFPAPLLPTNPKLSPFFISKESIFNTVVPLYVFERLFTCIIFEKVYSVIC